MPSILKPDPMNAVLLESPPLEVTDEQIDYLKEILDICCSDSRFAEKAFLAIMRVLTVGAATPPVVTSLAPHSAVLGTPSFDVHVMGTGFTPESVIVFNGFDEPTTFVSSNDVFTGVNMDVWAAPATLPVYVRNADGVQSDPLNFEFTSPAARMGERDKKIQEEKERVLLEKQKELEREKVLVDKPKGK